MRDAFDVVIYVECYRSYLVSYCVIKKADGEGSSAALARAYGAMPIEEEAVVVSSKRGAIATAVTL